MGTVINIEICKSPDKEGTYNMRIGDLEDCVEAHNMPKGGILELIVKEIDHLDNLKVAFKSVYTDGK